MATKLHDPLTPREVQVLALVVSGMSNKQIANELSISVGGVEQHLDHIYSKFHLSRTEGPPRAAAVRIAIETGIVSIRNI